MFGSPWLMVNGDNRGRHGDAPRPGHSSGGAGRQHESPRERSTRERSLAAGSCRDSPAHPAIQAPAPPRYLGVPTIPETPCTTPFADRFGLDVRAVQDWEQGRRVPDRAACVLLTVIDRDPEAVERALEEWTPAATTADVVREVTRAYQAPVMNNVHRSEYVEAIVAVALTESGWSRTTPWDSWDFVHESKFRMEVKQSAAAQAWSPSRASSPPRFDIRARSGYWDQSGMWRSSPGRHADVYVFAWHEAAGKSADQREPMSWQFYVILERDLPDQKTIGLNAIRRLAQPCRADRLHARLAAAMGQR